MRRAAWVALALLAPLALAALQGQAAPPVEQAWRADLAGAAANAGQAQALGFDDAGARAVVATSDRVSTTPLLGTPTPDNDLVMVLFDGGNVTPAVDAADLAPAEGKSAVAISGDGRLAVSGGNYSGTSSARNIFVHRLPQMTEAWSADRPEPVGVVAVSGDGGTIVVGTRATGTSPGRIYRFDAAGNQLWQTGTGSCGPDSGTGGSVLALDVSRDGRWIVAGTLITVGGEARGCALLFEAGSLSPRRGFLAGAEVTAVDISPNGAWYAAGTAAGLFHLLGNSDAGRGQAPLSDRLNTLLPVQAVRVPDDGGAILVADRDGLSRYAHTPGLLTLNWSAPLPGLRSLDATDDLDYVVAGGASVQAFHRAGNQSLWSLEVPNALVDVAEASAGDVRIIAASGGTVRGFRLHWALEVTKAETEPVALEPGQARSFTFHLANNGSAVDAFELSASAPGFLVDLAPASLTLRPGEGGNATLTMTPLPGLTAGLYRVDVVVRGVRSGIEHRTSVNASLASEAQLSMAFQDPSFAERFVFHSAREELVLVVKNAGNSRLELAYDLAQDPNVGLPWEASLSRTSGVVEAGGLTTNTLTVTVPPDVANGTENVFTVTARGDGVQAAVRARLVVNPIFTASLQVIPQSKVVEPGKSTAYNVVVTNNGTLRETYRLVYCVALPDLIPCLGNATRGLGGWSVALDSTPFTLNLGTSKSFAMAVAAPRGAIAGVDRLVLQVEATSATPHQDWPFHAFRDTKVVVTSVGEGRATDGKPPAFTPGFGALALLAGLGAVALALRRSR